VAILHPSKCLYDSIAFNRFWGIVVRMSNTEPTPNPLGSQNTTDSQTLRVGEIAKLAGVHPVSVRRAIQRGALSPLASIRHKIVSREQVESWIAGRKEVQK
jgi:hypothetical protein